MGVGDMLDILDEVEVGIRKNRITDPKTLADNVYDKVYNDLGYNGDDADAISNKMEDIFKEYQRLNRR